MSILLATLVDPLSPMIYAKIQPQSILGSREEDFLKVFTIYGQGGLLGQQTVTILAIFRSTLPKEAPYEILAKLAQRFQRRSCLKF